jgi:hypothetical protein
MLKTLRENFKHLKWVLWAVIIIFVLFVFLDWGMGSPTGDGGPDFAAKVGGSKITEAEFRREFVQSEDRYRQMYGQSFSPELARALNLPSQVLNSLVDRRLLKAEALRLGLSVSDEEVTARILRMTDQQGNLLFVKDGAFIGEATYRRMLAGANLSPEGFEADTREQALLEKLNRFVTEATFVGEDELKADFEGRTVKARIAYALFPAPALPPDSISDADAEARFKENPASYELPERRKGKYLLVESALLRSEAAGKVTDADISAEYTKNLDNYRKAEELNARHILYKSDGTPEADATARAKADAAVKKLKAGADFAALARAESEDPGSKDSGGDLGAFSRGRMVTEFEDAAFAAAQGEIAGPVKTPFGFHVIQVTGRSAERVQPLFEVAATIRARLEEERCGRRGAAARARAGRPGRPARQDPLRRRPAQADAAGRDVQRDRAPRPRRHARRDRPEPELHAAPLRAPARRDLRAGGDRARRGDPEADRGEGGRSRGVRRREGPRQGRPREGEAGGDGARRGARGGDAGRLARGGREGGRGEGGDAGGVPEGRAGAGPRHFEGASRRRVRDGRRRDGGAGLGRRPRRRGLPRPRGHAFRRRGVRGAEGRVRR